MFLRSEKQGFPQAAWEWFGHDTQRAASKNNNAFAGFFQPNKRAKQPFRFGRGVLTKTFSQPGHASDPLFFFFPSSSSSSSPWYFSREQKSTSLLDCIGQERRQVQRSCLFPPKSRRHLKLEKVFLTDNVSLTCKTSKRERKGEKRKWVL